MAVKKKKHTKWGRVKFYKRKPKVKSHTRRIAGVLEIAARNKSYKAAKKALAKATARSKRAWKKAQAAAKKIHKRLARKRR